MEKKTEVSVIIPVYNGELHLRRCLDSLVNQDFFEKNELIVVNDGSTDKTKEIIDEYEKDYPNIRAFHISNSGVSHARNYGIGQAEGNYITFVDADDWVERDYLNSMIIAGNNKADIIASGMVFEFGAGKCLKNTITDEVEWIGNTEAMKRFLLGKIDVHVCNKLFRRELLNNILFDTKIEVGEDRIFTCECLAMADKIVAVNKAFYHYVQNTASVMHEAFSTKRINEIMVGEQILHLVKEEYPELTHYAQCMMINTKCRILGDLYISSEKLKYQHIYEKLKKDIKEFSMIKSIRYSSKKHWISLLVAKIHLGIYVKLRQNQRFKYYKG